MALTCLAKTAALISLDAVASACGAGESLVKPDYSKAAIVDLTARAEGDQLNVRYRYPMESMFYSAGVNVERDDGLIKLVIVRCNIDGRCAPDVPSRLARPNNFQVEVSIPYRGERVVVVHRDGEQQIAP